MVPAPMELRERVAENPHWYHTIELAPGVVTPGHIDLRGVVPRILPARIEGRALDVGTFDGFWAFELERRGADTVAIDLDDPVEAEYPPNNRAALEVRARELGVELGRGFRIARDALGSTVERVACDVRELTPEAIGGPVAFAFLGALLIHLRDPVGALENVRGALVPGGRLHLLEPIHVGLTVRHPRRPVAAFSPLRSEFNWWFANLATVRAWLETAGFADVRRLAVVRPPAGKGMQGVTYAGFAARA
jgi:SAM-dependent methyltransferase